MPGIVKGSYSATWNSLDVGNTELGFRKSYNYQSRPVNFDAVGQVPVDSIFTGVQMTVDFVAQEYSCPAIDSMRWPFSSVVGRLSPAGQCLWDLAKPLVLTACNGTNVPQTITFIKAILAPDFDLELEYSHRLRPVPLRFIVYPVQYDATGLYTGGTLLRPDGCNDVVYFLETT